MHRSPLVDSSISRSSSNGGRIKREELREINGLGRGDSYARFEDCRNMRSGTLSDLDPSIAGYMPFFIYFLNWFYVLVETELLTRGIFCFVSVDGDRRDSQAARRGAAEGQVQGKVSPATTRSG